MTAQRYRKKPVEIEAVQWFRPGDSPHVGLFRYPPVDGVTGEISASSDAILMGQLRHCDVPKRFRRVECEHLMHDHGYIDTVEGGRTVCPGDWVITGVKGDEHYPCKPDIFEATYETA